jgi:hypothetical protein
MDGYGRPAATSLPTRRRPRPLVPPVTRIT